jgi:hypothetical protein
MIREQLMASGLGESAEFRWRGGNVSRLEGFSDAAFGFALTLLVVSMEVPKTFDELARTMRGFIPFAFCFFMLVWVWYRHFLFFRRYGLEDTWTIVLNGLLLFVVLFYIYPLKFLYTALNQLWFSSPAALAQRGELPALRVGQVSQLFVIYGFGFTAVFLIIALLYWHAYRLRDVLQLNPVEVIDTQESILSSLGVMSIGLLSVVLARYGGAAGVHLAGPAYFLIGLVEWAVGWGMGARRRRLEAELGLRAAGRPAGSA